MSARLGLVLVLLLALLPHAVHADTKPLVAPLEMTVKVKAKPSSGPAFLHHGTPRVLSSGTHHIAGVKLEVIRGKRHPVVQWHVDDAPRSEKLSKAKGHRLLLQSKPKRTLFVFQDLFERWHHAPGEGLRFEVRGIEFEMLDGDHDGVWFEPEVDLIRRVGDTHAVPLREPHVVDDWTLTVRAFHAAKSKLDVTVAPIDAALNAEEREVLATLNRERERMGFLGTISLPEFAKPLRLHAHWMALHNKVQHHEQPGTKGYTREGNAAGGASVILTHPEHADIATYVDIDSPIHGHVLTMPEFVQTGVGAVRAKKQKKKNESGTVYGGIWTMELEGFKHAQVKSVRFPQVWPPHMATGVPRSWTREGEDPRHPEDRGREQGYPIRVYLSPGLTETVEPKDFEVKLFAHGKENEPLDCFVIAPGLPLGYEPTPYLRHLLGHLKPIFVLPRPVLKADTWYVLRLKAEVEGKPFRHETAFRTSTQRGQYRNRRVGDPRLSR